MGFSRQEHWSRLPFPSPMHESEKWKWSRSVVSDSSRPRGLQPTRLLRPWASPGKSTVCTVILSASFCSHDKVLSPRNSLTLVVQWLRLHVSNAGKWKVRVKSLSRVLLFAIPWTAAYQAPPSVGFSRQEYWSGLPLPSSTPPELLWYPFSNWSEKYDRPVVGWEKPYRL